MSGMEYIGNITPESNIAGTKNINDDSMACCCVDDTVDIKSPMANVEIM